LPTCTTAERLLSLQASPSCFSKESLGKQTRGSTEMQPMKIMLGSMALSFLP
jgi:hypothetical protein